MQPNFVLIVENQRVTLLSCLLYEGHLTIGGAGRIGMESGLSDVQATMGKGKLPVTMGGKSVGA